MNFNKDKGGGAQRTTTVVHNSNQYSTTVYGIRGWSSVVRLWQSEKPSPYNSTRWCVSSAGGGICHRRALSPPARLQNCSAILLKLQSVCALVCSAVLLSRLLFCASVCLTSHKFTRFSTGKSCCNAVPPFSKHTYDIPLRGALIFVIVWGRSTLCCSLKRCIFSIGRLPPYIGTSPKAE